MWPKPDNNHGGEPASGGRDSRLVRPDMPPHLRQRFAHGGSVFEQIVVGLATVVREVKGFVCVPHGLVDLASFRSVVPSFHHTIASQSGALTSASPTDSITRSASALGVMLTDTRRSCSL